MTDELKIMAEVVSMHGDPEAFGDRELVAVADIQKLPYRTKLCRHDEALAEIERLRAEKETLCQQLAETDENTLLRHLAYIRQKSGVGMTPMLSELADAIAEKINGERNKALEDAATWHDAKVAEYTKQIAENNAYMERTGRTSAESRANEYCFDQRSMHRVSAAAIRAMKENKNEN